MNDTVEGALLNVEFAQLVRSRRSVNEFSARQVDAALVQSAIELARWAPNHHRTEPWRFYLIGETSRRVIAELNATQVRAKQGERAAEVKLRRWLAVPGWLVLTCQRHADALREREDYAACCSAAQNFMLALWSAGVGTKWTTGAVTREREFFAALDLDPQREFVVGLFWYGYPAAVGDSQRKPLADVLTVKA
jgi:nitroreductase